MEYGLRNTLGDVLHVQFLESVKALGCVKIEFELQNVISHFPRVRKGLKPSFHVCYRVIWTLVQFCLCHNTLGRYAHSCVMTTNKTELESRSHGITLELVQPFNVTTKGDSNNALVRWHVRAIVYSMFRTLQQNL